MACTGWELAGRPRNIQLSADIRTTLTMLDIVLDNYLVRFEIATNSKPSDTSKYTAVILLNIFPQLLTTLAQHTRKPD
jgi:hypothetical protein